MFLTFGLHVILALIQPLHASQLYEIAAVANPLAIRFTSSECFEFDYVREGVDPHRFTNIHLIQDKVTVSLDVFSVEDSISEGELTDITDFKYPSKNFFRIKACSNQISEIEKSKPFFIISEHKDRRVPVERLVNPTIKNIQWNLKYQNKQIQKNVITLNFVNMISFFQNGQTENFEFKKLENNINKIWAQCDLHFQLESIIDLNAQSIETFKDYGALLYTALSTETFVVAKSFNEFVNKNDLEKMSFSLWLGNPIVIEFPRAAVGMAFGRFEIQDAIKDELGIDLGEAKIIFSANDPKSEFYDLTADDISNTSSHEIGHFLISGSHSTEGLMSSGRKGKNSADILSEECVEARKGYEHFLKTGQLTFSSSIYDKNN